MLLPVVLANLLIGLAAFVSSNAIQMAIDHSSGEYAEYMLEREAEYKLERQNSTLKHER